MFFSVVVVFRRSSAAAARRCFGRFQRRQVAFPVVVLGMRRDDDRGRRYRLIRHPLARHLVKRC